MSSFYERIDETQREVLLEAYLYLAQRNGPLDRETGTLPKREARLQEMNTAAVEHPLTVRFLRPISTDYIRAGMNWRAN